MQRRAGAAFNGTDVLTGSLEIGHQASQAAAAAAASSSSVANAGTTAAEVDSDTVAGQTSVAVASTSALPGECYDNFDSDNRDLIKLMPFDVDSS